MASPSVPPYDAGSANPSYASFNPYANASPAPAEPRPDLDVQGFFDTYEVNPVYRQCLNKLIGFRSILVCDDSGSMSELADPDTGSPLTRWDELKATVQIIVQGHATFGTVSDVYFLNRPPVHNVINWSQVAPYFNDPPRGGTHTVAVLRQIQQHEVGVDMGKSIIIHLLTDGHATNDSGNEDMQGLSNWIMNRTFKSKTYFSIVLCTDEEAIERAYRQIQRALNIDMAEDFRGELRDVHRAKGRDFRFSKGDYVVKIMCGSYDRSVHDLDVNKGCCVIN